MLVLLLCAYQLSLTHNGPALGGQAGEGKLTDSHKIGGLQLHKTCSKNPVQFGN